MITPTLLNPLPRSETFWMRLLSDDALAPCENLEKLLVGCEIIAAMDDLDLLAA